jgi:hypothetical protein
MSFARLMRRAIRGMNWNDGKGAEKTALVLMEQLSHPRQAPNTERLSDAVALRDDAAHMLAAACTEATKIVNL